MLGRGHHVYTDNFYTSPELANELLKKDTYLVGTVKESRKGMPIALKAASDLIQGETVWRRNGQLLAIKWQDHGPRSVCLLSTIHRAEEQLYRTYKYNNLAKFKPTAIIEYVNKMAGVDKAGQLIQYRSCNRKNH